MLRVFLGILLYLGTIVAGKSDLDIEELAHHSGASHGSDTADSSTADNSNVVSRAFGSDWKTDSDEDSLKSLEEMDSSEEQDTCYCPCLNKRKSKLKKSGRRVSIQSSEEDENNSDEPSSIAENKKHQKGRLFFRG